MTRKTARANSFNGEARATSQMTPERVLVEQYLLNNAGHYTVDQIAQATGISTKQARNKVRQLIVENIAVNTRPGTWPATYRHREHHQREQMVNRREPITNACMPNGSTSYWRKHMTAFNTPPRAA